MKLVRKFKVEYDEDGKLSASSRHTIDMKIRHEYFIDTEDYLWIDEDCQSRLSPGVSIVEYDTSSYVKHDDIRKKIYSI